MALRFLQAVLTNSPLGYVRASTSKSYYVEGEVVEGTVHCDFVAPVAAKSITVVLEGYEKVEWHQRSDRSETIPGSDPPQMRIIPRYVRRRAKKTFFKVQIPVHLIAGNGMMPGQYNFPFSYQLPDALPGSFYERQPLTDIPQGCEFDDKAPGIFSRIKGESEQFDDSDDEERHVRRKVLAVINYKLKVTVDLVNLGYIPDLYCRIPLIVHPRLKGSIAPLFHEETRDVVVCCCFNKGSCHVACRFDKNAYVAGETIQVHADLDNQSTKMMPTQVQLHRTFTIQTNDGKADFSEDVIAVDYPPLQPKTKLVDQPLPLKLYGDKVKPTTAGNFISCSYMYQYFAAVSWGKDLEFSVPVTIYMYAQTNSNNGNNAPSGSAPLPLSPFVSGLIWLCSVCLCCVPCAYVCCMLARPQPPPPDMNMNMGMGNMGMGMPQGAGMLLSPTGQLSPGQPMSPSGTIMVAAAPQIIQVQPPKTY